MPVSPKWIRARTLGQRQYEQGPIPIEAISRLELDSCLCGHASGINSLEWNKTGSVLLSASNDKSVIVWDALRSSRIEIIDTQHNGAILSVKFMPNTGDILIATASSDCKVKVTDIIASGCLIDCNKCHRNRVKSLAVDPNTNHIFYSAGHDGRINRYDCREQHSCQKLSDPILDLKKIGLNANCIAVNPVRSELIAIGSDDIYTRVFDLRKLCNTSTDSCIARFSPGHGTGMAGNFKRPFTLGTTHVAFSSNGKELLTNLHGFHVYLYDLFNPREPYKSFDETVKPLLDCSNHKTNSEKLNLISDNYKIESLKSFSELPNQYNTLYETLESRLHARQPVTIDDIHRLNSSLAYSRYCVGLYQLRAKLLLDRGWYGDRYHAIRDTCCALALDPSDGISFKLLALASYYRGDINHFELLNLIDFLKANVRRNIEIESRRFEELLELFSVLRRELPKVEHPYLNTLPCVGSLLDLSHLSNIYKIDVQSMISSCRIENQLCANSYDYMKRFCGHSHIFSDFKEANFWGDNLIVSGSDDGSFYIWDKETTNIVKASSDTNMVHCAKPNPEFCMIATSGPEPLVKLWSPGNSDTHDEDLEDESLDSRCNFNRELVSDIKSVRSIITSFQ